MKDDIYYTIFFEHDDSKFMEFDNYTMRFDGINYEVYKYEGTHYKHLRNYDNLSGALGRISEELRNEGK